MTSSDQMTFAISLFKNKFDTKPQNITPTWDEICEKIANPIGRAEKDGESFSPALFDPPERKKDDVKELSMLVLDYDHKASLDEDIKVWRSLDIRFAVYTTHSHLRVTDKNPNAEERFRILIPLSEPIPSSHFPALWECAVKSSRGKIDTKAKDASRMFYLPAKVSPDAPYEHHVVDGKLLDWRALGLNDETAAEHCYQYSSGSNGSSYENWHALKAELGRRIMVRGKKNSAGNWDARALCHDGKGDSGVFYNPSRNQTICNGGCNETTILRAEGLPERPNGSREKPLENQQTSSFEQRVLEVLNAESDERDNLIRKLVQDLVSSAETLTIDKIGKMLKKAKVLSLTLWRELLKEERKRWRQLDKATAQAQDRVRREARLQELNGIKTDLESLHEKLTLTSSSPHSHDIIELALATSISHLLSKEVLLWLLIVGPPSSDKTQTALALKDAAQVLHLDTLTENAFISGFVSPDGNSPQDLLAELDGHCLTIKDLNSLFGQHPDKVAKVLGDLTAIYDGEFAKWTGTRGSVSYAARFSLIGCVTPMTLARHHRYMNMIGARFLSYRVTELSPEEVDTGFDTIWNEAGQFKDELRQLASAYATQLHQKLLQGELSIPDFGDNTKATLNALAKFLAHARAAVRTQRAEVMTDVGNRTAVYNIVEVQREEPFRALLQLRSLATALALIHKRNEVTEHELELCRRVVLSSMPYDRSLILALFQNSNHLTSEGGLTRKAAAEGIGKARNQAVRLLTELEAIGVLRGEKTHDNIQNVDTWTYYPASGEFATILTHSVEQINHTENLKKIPSSDVVLCQGDLTQNYVIAKEEKKEIIKLTSKNPEDANSAVQLGSDNLHNIDYQAEVTGDLDIGLSVSHKNQEPGDDPNNEVAKELGIRELRI
jgi:hypothetical protein